jgi:hypothetical protein
MCWRREDLKPSPAIWGWCCCHQNMTKQSFLCNIFTYWPQSLVSDLLQLDQGDFQACLSRQDSYVSLANGRHVFTVTVNMSSGASAVSQFNWTVGETFTKTFVFLVYWFHFLSSKCLGFHELCPDLQVGDCGFFSCSSYEGIEHLEICLCLQTRLCGSWRKITLCSFYLKCLEGLSHNPTFSIKVI